MHHQIRCLLASSVINLGPKAAPSGINKVPVNQPLRLGFNGFEGDIQADRRYHGGPDKALHHYPSDHYALWRNELGDLPVLLDAGAFGENLSGSGLDESSVAVGDVFRLGTAVVEVSQGRQPCWKLNARFGIRDMAQRVQDSGRTGWYYRVIKEGTVQPEDGLCLLDRRSPDWPLQRLWHVLYITPFAQAELEAMAAMEHLPESWRKIAARRLETGLREDWDRRLKGRD